MVSPIAKVLAAGTVALGLAGCGQRENKVAPAIQPDPPPATAKLPDGLDEAVSPKVVDELLPKIRATNFSLDVMDIIGAPHAKLMIDMDLERVGPAESKLLRTKREVVVQKYDTDLEAAKAAIAGFDSATLTHVKADLAKQQTRIQVRLDTVRAKCADLGAEIDKLPPGDSTTIRDDLTRQRRYEGSYLEEKLIGETLMSAVKLREAELAAEAKKPK